MLNQDIHWPSGIRDTTEFPTIDIEIKESIREHLKAFLNMDGVDWNDYAAQRNMSGQTVADSRMRTNRKMYERLGLIYRDNDKIRLSELGIQIKNLKPILEKEKEICLYKIRDIAISILSRYQLKNPVDGVKVQEDCNVHPCFCIWQAMRGLDDKIHYEEMNRVILHVMKEDELEEAIDKIRSARKRYSSYEHLSEGQLEDALGIRVHNEQPTARIVPWLSFAGWGGLIIKQVLDEDGYRHLVDDAIPQIDKAILQPPRFYLTNDKDKWLKYYIGSAREVTSQDINIESTLAGNYIKESSILDKDKSSKIFYKTNVPPVKFGWNRIIFGAPGTGKSWQLDKDKDDLLANGGQYERVTFHPDYTYSQFVGTYKPTTNENGDICYEFVPGPFMRTYVKALESGRTDNPKPYLLIIEEINRARVASVFGDIFQLLDRAEDGTSQYEIQASEDVKKYLASKLGGEPSNYPILKIPNNMFLWASMNSADQGVYPMDTAFKRRWNFEYLGIDANQEKINCTVNLVKDDFETNIKWNRLRKAINAKLLDTCRVNEDKLLGPFFLSKKAIKSDKEGHIIDEEAFRKAFKSKVIMYLFEDAARQYRNRLFKADVYKMYSSICDEFDKHGMAIFGDDFKSAYYDQQKD